MNSTMNIQKQKLKTMRQYVNMSENNVRRLGGAKSGQEIRSNKGFHSIGGIKFNNVQQKKGDPSVFYSK